MFADSRGTQTTVLHSSHLTTQAAAHNISSILQHSNTLQRFTAKSQYWRHKAGASPQHWQFKTNNLLIKFKITQLKHQLKSIKLVQSTCKCRYSWGIPNRLHNVEIRTFLSPDISQLVKFAGSDISQFIDFQGRTFLSYLFCRVGQFSVRTFVSWLVQISLTEKCPDWEMSGYPQCEVLCGTWLTLKSMMSTNV